MVSFLMIMKNELGGGPMKARFSDQNHTVQTGLFDTPHKALGESIQIRGTRWQSNRFGSRRMEDHPEVLAEQAGTIVQEIAAAVQEACTAIGQIAGDLLHPQPVNVSARNGSTLLTLATNSYDAASRLTTVSDGTQNATYTYLANSPLVTNIVFKQNSTTRMTTIKNYDFLNRLASISSSSAISFGYQYNIANQRTRRNEADGSYWTYEYDSLGQVKRGAKFFSDGYPVTGQQFEYGFDDIGNRKNTKAGGDENGWNLRPANYAVNALNQYTSRDVPGYVDVKGLALATNGVTVNGQTAYRKGEYFRKELAVGNGSAALWTNISVAATGETTASGNVFVP